MQPSIGETVRLKSDGRVMTVKAIDTDEQGKPRVTCVWLNMAMQEETGVYSLEAIGPAQRAKRAVPHSGGYTVEGSS